MRIPFVTVLSILFSSVFLHAQTDRCGTMYADSVLRHTIPGSPTLLDFENWLQQKMNEPNMQRGGGGIITIPVIVHVIHDGDAVGSGQNISQAQVMSQFDVLNEDFRRLNADAVNTPAGFLPVAADVEIEFCPAVVDPNGLILAEPGIDRVDAGQSTWSSTSDIDINLKPATIWDPNRYFNIWTVDFGSGSTLLGYAQFPEGSGLAGMPTGAQTANTDGIVCRYNAFGRVGNVNSPYNQGRTATHETGHWLGLRHIWGDGDCSVDDYCTDTPESDAANTGCQPGYISCGNVNMVQNYMDYSNDACMNIFTLCQKTRMQTVMQNSPRRVQLLNSTVCELLDQVDVSGQVRDAQTGLGVPFAKVRFYNVNYNYETDCDASGNFSIHDVFEGNYNVYGGKWGYVTGALNVDVETGMSPVIIPVNEGYYDDFVLDFAWTISGTATSGEWERAQPVGTTFNGVASNPGADVTNDYGMECFTTGNGGGAAGNDDVDNGTTILTSPVFDLTTYTEPYVKFYRWFYNGGGTGTPNDNLVVKITNGTATATIETLAYNTPNSNQWNFRDARVEDYVSVTATMQFIIETGDLSASGHLVEAGLDLFRITDSVAAPQAGFTANISGCAPLTVQFSDASTGNPTSWQWTFPGGLPSSSSLQNPVVLYSAPGTYNVTLTASNNSGSNSLTTNAFITVYSTPATSIASSNNAGCFNGNDGSAMLSVSGGTAPFTITWSDGQTGASRNNLSAGNYTATVTDQNGCRDTSSIISISAPTELIALTQSTPEYCGNHNGTVEVAASGGTTPYSVEWNTGAASLSLSGLSSGQYSVTVTDANNCVAVETTFVATNNNAPTITLSEQNISCFGFNDGAISSSVSGGTQPFNFIWSNGSNAQNISNLPSDTYIMSVTDANGCSATQSIILTEPDSLSVAAFVTDASCGTNNGMIHLTVTGGTLPYSYIWTTGSTFSDVSNLGTGNYSVSITDNNNCSTTRNFFIGQDTPITINESVTGASCGIGNGAISITVSSGNMPYTYTWSNGASSASIANLFPGNYSVTVSDGNSCIASKTITVPLIPNVTIGSNVTDATCGLSNGAIALAVSGGNTPYIYSWSTGSSTANLTALAAGIYSVTVTDDDGCLAQHTISVGEIAPPTASASITNATCGLSNGEIALTISGGRTPYSYVWSNANTTATLTALSAGTYTVTVTDNDGCAIQSAYSVSETGAAAVELTVADASCFGGNDGSISVTVVAGIAPFVFVWSTGDTAAVLSCSAGNYSVSVTDSSGCVVIADTVVSAPDELLLAVFADDLVCSDKVTVATASASGGTAPYAFLWNNTIAGDSAYLADGWNEVLLTDSHGCATSDSFLVLALPEPNYLLQSTPDTANQNTGTATVIVTSGTPPFTFLWNDAQAQTDSAATNLAAGMYHVTITDGNGCEVEDSVVVDAFVSAGFFANTTVSVYPNPNAGIFTIEVRNMNMPMQVEVYNALGEKIISHAILSHEGMKSVTTLDVRQHSEGIYFVRMVSSEQTLTRMVIYQGN